MAGQRLDGSSGAIAVKCTYPTCMKGFPSVENMQFHKVKDPAHFYCEECDVDCLDWDDLNRHKVDAMMPWLEGRMKDNKDESPVHIACEFCGQDFRSWGGRKLHIEQNHQADQDITCPGCNQQGFLRAGSLIAHFEDGHCPEITLDKFTRAVQWKHVNRQIHENMDAFIEGCQVNGDIVHADDETSTTGYTFQTQDTEAGGVPLLDQGNDDDKTEASYPPLQAEFDLMEHRDSADRDAQLTTQKRQAWPQMPKTASDALSQSMRKMCIGAPTMSFNGDRSQTSASQYASQITSRASSSKARTASYASSLRSVSRVEDAASEVSSSTGGFAGRKKAWAGDTSKDLFPNAKPAAPGEWDVILAQREYALLPAPETNLFQRRIWDPNSDDYYPDLFFDNTIEKYLCPFGGCDTDYDDAEDLKAHFLQAHLKVQFRCTLCLKEFKSASALVSHSESAGKCRVKDSSKFYQMLDEVTGGYLRGEHLYQPKVHKASKAMIKKGEKPVDGVMKVKFTAVKPAIKW